MTIEIRISMPEGAAPVYRQYDGQCQPQPAYIQLDEDGFVCADYSGEIGNAVPMSVWHNRDARINISPIASGAAIRQLFEDDDFLALVCRYYDGFETEWDGSNWVGRATGDAKAALEEIKRMAQDLDQINIFSASDWVEYTTREEMAQHGGYEGYAVYLDGLTDIDQLVEGGADAIEEALREKFADDEDEE